LKRYGDLYGAATSRAALYQGYYDARRGKRSSRACFQFERRCAAQIEALHLGLTDGTYRPQRYHVFQIFEPKPRMISAPAFRDRVVQHAVYNVLRPIFDRTFIDQSFACRVGKGTHLASDYVQAALARAPRDSYVLQLDIRRYYYRLDRSVLRGLIERKIKDRRLVDLAMMFAEMSDQPVGVPIGNLLSQLFGLIYLDPLDHFIKRDLKVRHYARYVDDFVLIGLTYEQAIEYRARIIAFLADRLRLELSHSAIHRVSRGVNFVGFRTWATARFVRKRALYSFRRAAKVGRLESVISSLGHAGKTGSRRSMFKHLRDNHHGLYRRLPESVRRLDHL
jgi:hypothetical protein